MVRSEKRTIASPIRMPSGAVMSIAFGRQTPVVDGNVIRVLCRRDRVNEDPRAPATQRRLWARAGALVPADRPGDFNQALMELGATVCTPKSPTCLLCPLQPVCAGLAHGEVESLPQKKKAKARRQATLVAALARDEAGGIWLGRRPAEGLLGGLWELPMVARRCQHFPVGVADPRARRRAPLQIRLRLLPSSLAS